jgi:hypothetical protein
MTNWILSHEPALGLGSAGLVEPSSAEEWRFPMMRLSSFMLTLAVWLLPSAASAYPPAVGIVGQSRSCTECHASNGPWLDGEAAIVDVLAAGTRQSLRQPDGRFLLEVERGRTATVITVIGRQVGDSAPPPLRNAWLYVDPTRLETSALSKFAPGWDVNLPMSCRIVGDDVPEYPGATVTALPMTLRAGDAAAEAELELQVMLKSGESVKGEPNARLISNYLVRKLILRVLEP